MMMWLFQDPAISDEFSAEGFKLYSEAIKNLYTAAKEGAIPETNIEILTGMESKAKVLQRTISGIALEPANTEKFREKLEGIYFGTGNINRGVLAIGGSFKDITETIAGLSDALGRVVEPNAKVVEQMVEVSKATGIAATEVGKMTGEFMKLTFSQQGSMDLIKKISEDARRSGLNVKATLSEVQKQLTKVAAYNFKNGVDGLTKMVLQAQRLGVTIDDIGAASLGRGFAFDPEKAVEAAAGMSMLGGAMSNMKNPFQLMNMGANDVGKLQNELLELSKSAFSVDESTGKIESNAIAQQRLYEQLKAVGKEGDFDKFMNMGREAAKQAEIVKKVSDSGLGNLFGEGKMFDEKQQGLIYKLAEIDTDGKISLEIPGAGKFDDLAETLKTQGGPAQLEAAIKKYDEMAEKSEKDIAMQGLTLAEDQLKDTKIIKETVVRALSPQERSTILKNVEKAMSISQGGAKTLATGTITNAKTELGKIENEAESLKSFNTAPAVRTWIESLISADKDKGKLDPTQDGFFDDGKKKLLTGKGEMFSFIEDDQALFAPNLDENLGIMKSAYLQMKELSKPQPKENTFKNSFQGLNTVSKTETKTEQTVTQRVEGSGTVNINVNITSSGNLANSLMSDRTFKNQLETEILTTIKNKDILMVKKP
jgi:alpha-L-fucosidase